MPENHTQTYTPYQPNNPTNADRYALASYALAQRGRPEDFEYIIKTFSPPPDITKIANPGEFKNMRVGVIGGGLAGLAAAFELRKLGFEITVFEAQEDHIGGRVYTYYFNREKTLYGELGAMRIPVTHETVWHYINHFRLNTRPFVQYNENAFIYLRKVRVRNDYQGYNVMKYIYPRYNLSNWERRVPWQQLGAYGLENHILCAPPAVRSEIIKVLQCYNSQTLFWDYNNTRQMMESARLSESAIYMLSNLLPLAGAIKYNSYIDYVQEVYSVDLAFLYEIKGGIANLPMEFFRSLVSERPVGAYPNIPMQSLGHVRWKSGNWVTGIKFDTESRKAVVSYKHKGSREALIDAFDYVVCAIPFSTLRTVSIEPLFSERKMEAIKEVTYIPAQKTALLCTRRFWEEDSPYGGIVGGGSYTDLPITTIWYPSDHERQVINQGGNLYNCPQVFTQGSNKFSAREPGVILGSYNFGLDTVRLNNMEPGMRAEEIKREVEAVHGLPRGYLDSVVAGSKTVSWENEPWFRGALCFYTPEQKRSFSYVAALPEYNGRVHFAGEHISAKHRWMQGALKSGMEAANNIALACRIKKQG